MKFFRVALLGIIIVGAFLCWLGLSGQESPWPTKHGELCWWVDAPNNTATVKLAVVRTFEDHYIVHGTVTDHLETGDYVRCLIGSAEIVGNKVIIHGSTSGIYGTELIGSIGIMEMDLLTLNGTSTGINLYYDTAWGTGFGGFVGYDGEVPFVFIECD